VPDGLVAEVQEVSDGFLGAVGLVVVHHALPVAGVDGDLHSRGNVTAAAFRRWTSMTAMTASTASSPMRGTLDACLGGGPGWV
jgi:hypothetical protein